MICWSCERAAPARRRRSARRAGRCSRPTTRPITSRCSGVPRALRRRRGGARGGATASCRAGCTPIASPRPIRARGGRRWRGRVQLNEAWRTLKDPVRRAEYLLALAGIDVGGDEATQRRETRAAKRAGAAGVPDGDPGAARGAGARRGATGDDAHGRGAWPRTMRGARGESMAAVARGAGAARGRRPRLEAAARELVALRYFQRFLDEVAAHDERGRAARDGGWPWLRRCSRSPSRASRGPRRAVPGRARSASISAPPTRWSRSSTRTARRSASPTTRRRAPLVPSVVHYAADGDVVVGRRGARRAGAGLPAGHHRLGQALHGARAGATPRPRAG